MMMLKIATRPAPLFHNPPKNQTFQQHFAMAQKVRE
jgi:hypothetical protein